MMKSKEIILTLTELITYYLNQLTELPRTDFVHGEMTAYVECLEILSKWENFGAPQDFAKKYNI